MERSPDETGGSRRNDNDERRGNGGRDRKQRERGRSYSESQDQVTDDSPEKKLSTLLIILGDKMTPQEIHKNIEKIADIVQTEYSKYEPLVLKTIKNCFMELPMKTFIYGTLVGLVNVKRPDIGSAVVKMTAQTLQQCLNEGNWRGAKFTLKFFAELTNANVILPRTMLDIYDDLLTTLDEPNVKLYRADTIVYIVLSTLPFVALQLRERSPEMLDSILSKIERYFESRERAIAEIGGSVVLHSVTPYIGSNLPYDQSDTLDILWSQIQSLRNKGWECKILLKPWSDYDSFLVTSDQHEVDKFIVKEHSHKLCNSLPVPLFRVFGDLEDETIVDSYKTTDISYFLIRDIIDDIIEIYEINRKECTKYLKDLPYNFASGTFVEKDTTTSITNSEVKVKDEPDIKIEPDMDTFSNNWGIDNSKEANASSISNQGIVGFKLEQIIVEEIFSHIFRLPQPRFKPIFYHSLLTEICKICGWLSLYLGKAIGILFDRLGIMDVECCYRFWNWFAHHLSNFGFVWNWKDWESTLQLDPMHPKVCFIRETLEKTIRYSYYDRIRSTIPEEFLILFPTAEPSTNFRYEDPDHRLNSFATSLISKLRNKSPNSEIQAHLEEVGKSFPDLPAKEKEQTIRDLFVQCVLMLGSKSFSHVLNVIERYLLILQSLNETPESRLHTVKIVAEFWVNNTQFLGILLDKLLNYRVIDAIAVISWLFSNEMEKDIAKSYVWEIMKNTINKVISRVKQVISKREMVLNPQSEIGGQGVDITSEEDKKINTQELHTVENTLNAVTREQKEVLLKVAQMFVSLLDNRLKTYESQGITDAMSQLCFWWAYGFFKEIARTYQPQISTFLVTMETIVITPDLNQCILNVIEMVKAFEQMKNATIENDFS
ncbi:ARM repeat-containing protein [Gigaspora margarita]|uniref:ARM repeat-containing protein n=1 Tax=Gigaspora margarita TaxID=4874 RepID=A0A8H4B1V8_GIGMA|nr:ARM repeat-containing protein [Gigaspora margarita]